MAVRDVIQAGHPALKAKNQMISDFASIKVKHALRDLFDTFYATDLVGIAAPQIALNYSIFVTHPRNTASRKIEKEDIYRVYINPKIVHTSSETVEIYEACGSLDTSLFGPVVRSKEVTVEAYDEAGKKFTLTCDGLLARIIQHEYDHLQGIEFIQKVSDYNRVLSKEFYIKNIKNSPEHIEAAVITKIEFKFI